MRWELESIYTDAGFAEDLNRVKGLISENRDIKPTILSLQEAGKVLKELDSFAGCLVAQDPSDANAQAKSASVSELQADYEEALFSIGNRLNQLDEQAFNSLLNELTEISFFIREIREIAKLKRSESQEKIINSLSADGYHGLWNLYQAFTGKMKIGEKGLSVGQAQNLLDHGDRNVRQTAFKEWTEGWKKESDFLAQLLNSLGGFRLKVYAARGWDDVLTEPLYLNRMKPATFQAMWKAVEEVKPAFFRYLQHKAKLLGLKKLSWFDVDAPLSTLQDIPYDEGRKIILEQFEKFHPRMARFAKTAFEKRWIETEDRPGKAAGGFCVSLPKSHQSRIFMTYKGTPSNVSTLAHELGHAYHNYCVDHLPYFHQQAQMNVAETASTFAEMVVIDQTIAAAKTAKERQQLLDDKLQSCITFLMNLHSRLLFEEAFYAERRNGFVPAARLCELMEAAQRKAYGDALSDWDPYFWASKLHFFYTHSPFYNFPYTFGYLMSNGLYAMAKKGNFGEKLDAFLSDTAQMNVEDLAAKHLGVDLTQTDFWRASLEVLVKDIEAFIQSG